MAWELVVGLWVGGCECKSLGTLEPMARGKGKTQTAAFGSKAIPNTRPIRISLAKRGRQYQYPKNKW